jgi:hypothetical protein
MLGVVCELDCGVETVADGALKELEEVGVLGVSLFKMSSFEAGLGEPVGIEGLGLSFGLGFGFMEASGVLSALQMVSE